MDAAGWARELSEQLLADVLPRRWNHSQGVGRKSETIAHLLGDDGDTLICAAWLHDIGYAPSLVDSGSHALDGARYLRDVAGADERICRLVAHHSCAAIEARNRGLHEQLEAEFPYLDAPVTDALTYCDMTTSPDGEPTEVHKRLDEILVRYEPGSTVHDSIAEAAPRIIQAVESTLRLHDR
ncbi:MULTISPECIES: HD domain-containing protein [Catenuloplanes]|uniref:Nucleotidyltransferase with HDIG domain n=1 Tax=Catenuloplanes niger TaxID=587534 RepID=A0AAE3ZP20_9ACTN|nr:HD domain-containing protein [Catenuloplanes niger]MDR7322442.1 putative nucleotidyltransferase with HDIG domain [Catenuloplanes niger]